MGDREEENTERADREAGRCTRMRVSNSEREMGRDEAKAYQIVPLLLQRTITYVFIVLWTHTGCLCRGQ